MTTTPVLDQSAAQGMAARAGLIVAGLIILFYAVYYSQRPMYNWDMIAYVAVALEDAGEPAEDVHRHTYAIVESMVPPDRYKDLTDASDYRRMVAGDAARFAEQLPFYAVKPAYPGLISLLYRFGINPVSGSLVVSAASYAGICILLYLWMSRFLVPMVAVPVLALFALLPNLTWIAQASTPDGLSVLALLLAVYLIIAAERPIAGATVLLLAIPVRPENIIYVVILLAYLTVARGLSWRVAAILGASAVAIYEGLTIVSHNYGWRTLFYYTHVDMTVPLVGFHSPLTLVDYAKYYIIELDRMIFLGSEGFTLFLLAAFGAVVFKVRNGLWRDPYLHLAILAVVFMAVRTLAFPGDAHRALLAAYLMGFIAFLEAAAASARRAR